MQLPSINHISRKTTQTLQRFPLTLLSASTAVIIAIYLAELEAPEVSKLFNIILVALLGIPLFTVAKLAGDKGNWSAVTTAGAQLLGFVLLVGYYFILPTDLDSTPYVHIYRYMLYVLGAHLLVAIGPYWIGGRVKGFWQYNKTLLLRFLTAIFFSGVLFAGLSIALLSIDVLLGISIEEQRYLQLFFFMGGIFNTWFFLAGIPSSIEKFSAIKDYPKGLKIFTQNILIPLVVIYVVILYLYAGKILIQWSWPEGWVANLILTFSIAGILALLLLHPIQEKAENRWIKRFSKGYFWALVPLVGLLLMAIYRRVWEYGITVERYLVIILGFWLAAMVAYFLFSKTKSIKVIPGSLCVIAFLISFGPWGAFSVAERSQINRLETYLIQNNILEDETIQKASATVPLHDRREISSIVEYLNNTHGLDAIQPWFAQDFDSLTTKTAETDSVQPVNHYNRPQYVVELMGIEYERQRASQPLNTSYSRQFTTNRNNMLNVRGINELVQNLNWSPQGITTSRTLDDGRKLMIRADTTDKHLQLYFDENKEDTVTIALGEVITKLKKSYPDDQYSIPAKDLTFDYSNASLSVRVYVKQLSWREEDGEITLQNVQFDVGLK